ncbi:MAG: sigma-70 family RNA polymerase sigma factor [Phycisphaeraceae bacterium]|nr:sigma-70 family RNA polymerase sigma factor [Phycisphaeraceae bacterium]
MERPTGDSARRSDAERDWVGRSRNGDREAFSRIYERHVALVHAVILARVPRSEAEDLTQEVFVAAWRRLRSLRDAESLTAWLAAIARNRARDWAKSNGRRNKHERRAATPDIVQPSPSHTDHVLSIVRSLPEALSEPLLLRLVAGLSGPQIAERLGLTHGSVRVALHRGMAQLRARLSEEAL